MSDYWDFYLSRVDDQPASIFVDLGISKDAPIGSHATMGYLRVIMRRPRKNGLSSQEEYDDLIALEDRVTAKITQHGTAIFVGRNTSSGNRDFYFYVTDPAKFESAAQVGMQEFPAYKYETGAREDKGWRTYFEFLYPSKMDWQLIMSRRVRHELEKRGDDTNKEREIEHFALFPSREIESAFANYVQAEGFAVKNTLGEPDTKGQFGLAFSRADQPAQIDEVVVLLFQKAAELGGVYDGWGCPVST